MSRFPKTDFRTSGGGQERSFALIMVLGLISIISLLLIFSLSLAQNERYSSFNYSQSIKADEIAQGGLNYVIANLLQEITDTNRTTLRKDASGDPIYVPATNAYAVPERMAASAIPATLINLVKISSGTVPFYVNGPILASTANSSSVSINGRSLSRARWNQPQLIDTNAVGDFVYPDWILVTRAGLTNSWNPAMAQSSSSQAAIGRIAFAVYDEGGLLDVGASGSPKFATNDVSFRRKGILSFADATTIPSFSNPDAFVAWRNAASAANLTAYTNYAYTYGATNGFLKVAPGDRAILSRQDLIQYAQANPSVLGTNALPYLTTFTRELNSPSYSPRTPTNSAIPYATRADTTGATNVDFAPLRNSTNQPLARFPLSRIALFSNPTGNAAAIQQYFGLMRDADGYSWDYNPDGASAANNTAIDVLSSVPSSRAPNFFELLQAGILRGSLAQAYTLQGTPNLTGGVAFFGADTMYDQNSVRHLLSIGANIIDQYNTNSMPLTINIKDSTDPTGTPVVGMANMPYVTEISVEVYRPTVAEGGSTGRQAVLARMFFEVWNPLQNATTPPSTGPSNFRIVAHDGGMTLFAYDAYNALTPQSISPTINFGTAYTASPNSTVYQIQFANQAAFTNSTLLTTANSTNFDSRGVAGTNSGIYLGGYTNLPDSRLPNPTVSYEYEQIKFEGQSTIPSGTTFAGYHYGISIDVQFQDTNGNWHTYQSFPYGLAYYNNVYPTVADYDRSPEAWETWDLTIPELNFSRIDPRGNRWQVGATYTSAGGPTAMLNQSLRPSSANGVVGGEGMPGGSSFTPAGLRSKSSTEPVGMLSDNRSTSAYNYTDPDGVRRPADGNTAQNVLPMSTGDTLDRPVLLNRPFCSVGELGYAFRDLPWKTLDFWTGESADAGLLDLFTAYDNTEITNSVVAGKISLNTRRPEVLAAMLSGAGSREEDSTQYLSTSIATNVAQDIVNFTTNTPFVNKADLVSLFLGSKENQFTANYSARKTEREAIVRALADVGQTRTWNLLIDIVAQAGKYPPTATSADQFNVEGERRYWLHVAIDRYTGQIIDSQLEPVNE